MARRRLDRSAVTRDKQGKKEVDDSNKPKHPAQDENETLVRAPSRLVMWARGAAPRTVWVALVSCKKNHVHGFGRGCGATRSTLLLHLPQTPHR